MKQYSKGKNCYNFGQPQSLQFGTQLLRCRKTAATVSQIRSL